MNAISWKMKKKAIVITMNVCRLTRSAARPNGTAMTAPTAIESGSRANTVVPVMFQSLAAMPIA